MTAHREDPEGPETGPAEAAQADRMVADALMAFEITVDALRDAVAAMRAERDRGEKAVMGDLKAMNAAFLFALQMQEKARAAGVGTGAGGGGGALDLERARAEVGLRLARLRAAGEGGGVSGGAE